MGMRAIGGLVVVAALSGSAAAKPGELLDTLHAEEAPPLTVLDAAAAAPCALKGALCILPGSRSTIAVATAPDKAALDKATPDKAAPDKAAASGDDEATGDDKAAADKAAADKAASDKAAADKASAGKAVADKAASPAKPAKAGPPVPRFSRAASLASSDGAPTPAESAPWTIELSGTLKRPAWAGNALFLLFDLEDPQSVENRQFTALYQAPLKPSARLGARLSLSPEEGFRAGHTYRLRIVQLINGREIVLGEGDLSLL